MKITDLLTADTIELNLQSSSKDAVIDELIRKLDKAGKLHDPKKFKEEILAREAQSTTGIGEGIAIPHAKTSAVKMPAIVFGRSLTGINYESLDGKPAHLFFMIAASEGANQTHLQTLSRLSSFLMDLNFLKKLKNAQSLNDIIKVFNEKEAEENEEDTMVTAREGQILAVTACPTGIAHTFMAADSLKAKAKELGYNLKVETNGSNGVENKLTAAEIKDAVAIIVAADTAVEMDRFDGKHVITVPVAEGIRNSQQLIEKASKQSAPIYRASSSSSSREVDGGKGKSGFYKHIMNGVSNMLPFVVGGGILIALSFMFGIEAFKPDHPSYHPIAEALMTIGGGNAFGLMVPILAGFIAMSIADRPGFAPGMVGGLMAATGGAGFLGGLIAGFLAGYIVLGLRRLFSGLPKSLEGIKPVLLYPLFGILITGMTMLYVIIKPVVFLNTTMENWLGGMGTGNLVLLGLILGGMMAIDMGGPINKAAFAFGIAMIEAGNLAPHAAVMAGGMVPPLGIALATTLFKNKFTKSEKAAGKTNYILGASFITEGAIPFAASDPGRVIPSIIVGSAVAGALTMVFRIGLPAPHGGLFVIPLVNGNPLMYILAILIGALITALMLGFWKKDVKE